MPGAVARCISPEWAELPTKLVTACRLLQDMSCLALAADLPSNVWEKIILMDAANSTSVTISHIFGELAWLFTQSVRHNTLPISELTWQLMPVIARRQFHLFRDGDRPIGAATWALLDETSEQLLIESRFHPPYAGEEAWSSGDRLWVIDIVAPFSTDENKQVDVIFGDLVTGSLKGKAFKMLYVDPASGERKPVQFDADTGARMVDALSAHSGR